MKKKPNFLISRFSNNSNKLTIKGQKLPPPIKRITLYQSGIKILSARIIYKHKKGDIEFEVIRINHLKSLGEIRLHTNNILYPGIYVITLEYHGTLDGKKLT